MMHDNANSWKNILWLILLGKVFMSTVHACCCVSASLSAWSDFFVSLITDNCHFHRPNRQTFFKRKNIFHTKSLEYKPGHCHVLSPPQIILAHLQPEISIQTAISHSVPFPALFFWSPVTTQYKNVKLWMCEEVLQANAEKHQSFNVTDMCMQLISSCSQGWQHISTDHPGYFYEANKGLW